MKVRTMSLKDHNYEVTEGECPECEDAALWVNTHELVCEECHQVYRDGDQHTGDVTPREDPAVSFYDGRVGESEKHRYDHSDKPIMPGGFKDAYDPNKDNGIYGDDREEDELLDTRRRV